MFNTFADRIFAGDALAVDAEAVEPATTGTAMGMATASRRTCFWMSGPSFGPMATRTDTTPPTVRRATSYVASCAAMGLRKVTVVTLPTCEPETAPTLLALAALMFVSAHTVLTQPGAGALYPPRKKSSACAVAAPPSSTHATTASDCVIV